MMLEMKTFGKNTHKTINKPVMIIHIHKKLKGNNNDKKS